MFKATENSMSSGTALITGASSGIGAIYSIPIRAVKWEGFSVGASPTPLFTTHLGTLYADGLRRQLQPNRTPRVPRQVPPSRYFGIVNGQRRNRG
ncbi:MAG: hypothetical protein ACJ8CR_27625 [Roseiflexaceae bacterium]